ncbi:MAG: cell envelope integrity protein TolA [Candidatus Binataceae bacterium]
MDTNIPGVESEPSRWGYAGAILVSALSHAALAVLLLVVLPSYLSAPHSEPPAYTVKIVDDIPAGDLGTHLPRLSHRARPKEAEAKPPPPPPKQEPVVTKPPPPPPPPPENDKNAIALNSIKPTVSIETPTPHPTPPPVITPAPNPTPTEAPKPRPTPKPHEARKPPTPRPTPKPLERSQKPPRPKPSAAVAIARVESTPSVKQQMNELRARLLAEHLAREKTAPKETPAESDEGDEETESSGGGPVVAKEATEGTGAGIGSGNGSMGIQQDLDFLLYYRTVQQRIKQAWSFSGGSNDLSTQVAFAIGPDGKLTDVKITRSSHDTAFDESVLRAIRRAAPFPAPPDKYRDQFAHGIEAVFRLGELNS